MTDDDARRAAIHQRSAELLDRADAALEQSRQREVPEALWQPKDPEPRAAPQPAPAARPRAAASPSPPWPDKVTIPKHDASGRIVAAVSYESAASVSAAVSWETWIRGEIDRRVGGAVKEWVWKQLEAVARETAKVDIEIAAEQGAAMRDWVRDELAALEERLSEPSRHVVVPALQSAVSGTTPTARGPGFPTGRGGQQRSRSAMHDAA